LLVLCVDGILIFVANAPCAIVPLNPNELSREPLDSVVRGTTSTGIWNGYDDTIDDRCAFSPLSWALIATAEAIRGPTTNDARPAAAAAGSKWPTFDLRDVHWIATLP
jgi:hypothetical protein